MLPPPLQRKRSQLQHYGGWLSGFVYSKQHATQKRRLSLRHPEKGCLLRGGRLPGSLNTQPAPSSHPICPAYSRVSTALTSEGVEKAPRGSPPSLPHRGGNLGGRGEAEAEAPRQPTPKQPMCAVGAAPSSGSSSLGGAASRAEVAAATKLSSTGRYSGHISRFCRKVGERWGGEWEEGGGGRWGEGGQMRG